MMRSPSSKLIFIISINVAVLLGNLYLLSAGFSLLDRRTESLTQEVQQQLRVKQQMELYQRAPHQTEEQIQDYEAQLSGVTVDQQTISERLSTLEQIAQRFDVDQNFTIDVKEEITTVDFVPVSISTKGKFTNVLAYMRELERTPFLFGISNPSIDGNQSASGSRPNLAPGQDQVALPEQSEQVTLTMKAQMLWRPSE